MKPPRVDIHVEEILLSGLGSVDEIEFSTSFRDELERGLAEGELADSFRSDRSVASIHSGALKTTLPSDATSLGAETARSVLRGLQAQGSSGRAARGDGPVTQQ